jgi:hypothetical protein
VGQAALPGLNAVAIPICIQWTGSSAALEWNETVEWVCAHSWERMYLQLMGMAGRTFFCELEHSEMS